MSFQTFITGSYICVCVCVCVWVKSSSKKKILLILDDVDKMDQLEHLAGGLHSVDWFGSGSRIIITTRDIHLLDFYGIERTYEVDGLNQEEALELFSWNASRRKQITPSYQEISKRVIQYSNGLPLSLEIIGSDLFGLGLDLRLCGVVEKMGEGRFKRKDEKWL